MARWIFDKKWFQTIARQQLEGAKKDKTRITIAFTCNASGMDRFEPLFIGHSEKPRCFKKKSGVELGFFYLHNQKAWMTAVFFQTYLLRFNRYVKPQNSSSHGQCAESCLEKSESSQY